MLAAWNRFWYREGPTLPLGLFRILFALCLLRELEVTRTKSIFAIEGGFHVPYLEWIPLVSLETYQWILDLQYPLLLLLLLGLWMRPACAGLVLLQGWVFFSDQLNFRNHPYFFWLVLIALTFSPADRSLSVRAWLRRRRARASGETLPQPTAPLTWQRLIQVQVSIVYVYAAIHKINPAFLGGEVLARSLELPDFLESWAPLVRDPPAAIVFALVSVLVELLLPVGLWWRRARPIALVVGILFHLSIAIGMGIKVFSAATIATYLLFLEPETVVRVRDRLARRWRAASAGGRLADVDVARTEKNRERSL